MGCFISQKGGSPIGSFLGNQSSNYFIIFFTLGGKTLDSESVTVHVSAPLQRRRPKGGSDRSIF